MAGTKERIIGAAASLFQRRGYVGSGLKQISADSQAPFGSLYHFFPGGKEQLAAETLRFSGKWYQALVEAVWDNSPDSVSAARNVFEGAAATLVQTDYADACPIATVALEVASTNENLRQVTAAIFEEWLGAATTRLCAAGMEPATAREVAILVIAALEGGFLLSRAAKTTEAMEVLGRLVARAVDDALPPR
jgi:AcrR family transcriptional regulator